MNREASVQDHRSKLQVGEWVEVRSKEEILETLDSSGRLDGMPFMPEMFPLCGKRMQVYKRAHKTCDTVFPVRGRRVDQTVHLNTRCDGSAHGGCQAGCLIFWKEAWLKPVSDQLHQISTAEHQASCDPPQVPVCSEEGVWANTISSPPSDPDPTYACQATQLPYATRKLDWWDIRQYVEDYTSGNTPLSRIIAGAVYAGYYNLSQAGIGLGRPLRWLHEKMRWIWKGPSWPRKAGMVPDGEPTPDGALNLQPGELVRVKSHDEILSTLNSANKNRGLFFDAELVPYCGQTFLVQNRVTQIIQENTGKMMKMKNPCIILEDVFCRSRYSNCRMFCPREIYSWWREIWLERVPSSSGNTEAQAEGVAIAGRQ